MKILVTGASGQLGAYLLEEAAQLGHAVVGWSGARAERRGAVDLQPVDLADLDAIDPALDRAAPAAIIHAAAISSAEAVRVDPDRAALVNVRATRRIAEWAESRRRRFVFTSTDLVFAGDRALSREDDPAEPTLAYGRTKRAAEVAVVVHPVSAVLTDSTLTVARLPLLYGPSRCGRPSFFDRGIAALRRGEPQAFFADEYRTPLDLRSAARGLIQLAASDVAGLIHLAGPERLSRFELMTRAAAALGIDPGLVRANRRADAPGVEARPGDVSLATDRWRRLFPGQPWPTVEAALAGEEGRGSLGVV